MTLQLFTLLVANRWTVLKIPLIIKMVCLIPPLKVLLQVNVYDRDNNEEVGQLKIFDNTNHRGTFYYFDGSEYVKLAEDGDGNFILDGADIVQSLHA